MFIDSSEVLFSFLLLLVISLLQIKAIDSICLSLSDKLLIVIKYSNDGRLMENIV